MPKNYLPEIIIVNAQIKGIAQKKGACEMRLAFSLNAFPVAQLGELANMAGKEDVFTDLKILPIEPEQLAFNDPNQINIPGTEGDAKDGVKIDREDF